MDIQKVFNRVQGLPHMELDQAEEITRIITENRFQNLLELGFCHGVSTCYMAAALDEIGGGTITTIDLESALENTPGVEMLLKELGLEDGVTVFHEPTSYVWRLMKLLEEGEQRFDFCYIDGAHDWFNDGFAFFLVDRLLKPGGMIIFDDLDWTYNTSATLKNTDFVKAMPEEERLTPQVRKVYELLVKKHPNYGDFVVKNDWAMTRKIFSPEATTVETEVVYEKVYFGFGALLMKLSRKLFSKF